MEILAKIVLAIYCYCTDFIINPYCGDFEFNSYTNKFYPQFKKDHLESKKEVYSTLNLNDSTFSLLKDKIKPDYTYKNISQDLSNNESKLLITFSGISDKILFVEMIKLCNSISFNEINVNKSYLKRKREAVSSLVILLNNNKVVDILVENMIASERQCTDISDNE